MISDYEKRIERKLTFLVGAGLFSSVLLGVVFLLVFSTLTQSLDTWNSKEKTLVLGGVDGLPHE